ncbi:hypothetical protein HK105_201012 [Polyrhizophydium stewartii]|uniref:Uncharacterized protein n=1 Tax=Polyrhizophydium stewartii TaxID=2732419 RepID=A0ABR4NIU6_9FUNG
MSGFFDTNILLWYARPRFAYAIEYIRKASASGLLKGLLVVTLLVAATTAAHLCLLYWTFTPAALLAVSAGCTVAQITLVMVETDQIKTLVPNVDSRVVIALRVVNAVLFVTLAPPALLRGILFIDANAAGVVPAWYRAADVPWITYVMFYDFAVSVFILLSIWRASSNTLRHQPPSSSQGSASQQAASGQTSATDGDAAVLRRPSAIEIRADFRAKIRNTVVWLALFFVADIVGVVAHALYFYFSDVPTSPRNLIARAYIQIGVAAGGPHVVFISLTLYNATRIVLASHGRAGSTSGRSKRGSVASKGKPPKGPTTTPLRTSAHRATMSAGEDAL